MAALYREQRAKAEAEQAERRSLVLADDELAKRLTAPPIGFANPRQWTGYIPPLMIEGPERQGMVRNPSPIRVQLVAIVREAYARNYGEATGRAWLQDINTDQWSGPWSPHSTVTNPTD